MRCMAAFKIICFSYYAVRETYRLLAFNFLSL